MTFEAAILPFCGGLLIGAAALTLWITIGRIFGVSSIIGGMLGSSSTELPWRVAVLLGLLTGGILMRTATGLRVFGTGTAPLLTVIVAGLLVGFGTRLGGGCTSGHGVCGVARLSKRSLVATLVFMAFGMATVYVMRHVLGQAQ